jgi:hypothetical protein
MNPSKGIRTALDSTLDALEMVAFNQGFEAATNALDELSDMKHNQGETDAAEVLRWVAKELRGENA